MPPAGSADYKSPDIRLGAGLAAQCSTDVASSSASHDSPQEQTAHKTRLLLQVFDSKAPLTCKSTAIAVLSTFIRSDTSLASLRAELPTLGLPASDKGTTAEALLRGRDFSFWMGAESPATATPVFYEMPLEQEDEEMAICHAPVLLVKLKAPEKSKAQADEEASCGFAVEAIACTDCSGNPFVQDSVVLHPTKSTTSHELCEMLKKALSDSALFDEDPKIPVSKLFTVLPGLKKMSGGSKAMAALVETVESHKKKELSKVNRLVNSGNVTFDVLEHILAPGTKIVTERKGVEGMLIGGKVESTRFCKTWCGDYFEVTYTVVKSGGQRFHLVKERALISAFKGARPISKLPIRVMTTTESEALAARGKKFVKYGLGSHYLSYSGNLIKETWMGPHFTQAQGRIMVDIMSFERINPNMRERRDQHDDSAGAFCVDEHLYDICWPTLRGFSFAAKKWGEIAVDDIEEIVYDEGAFDALVLDSEKKSLLRALVSNYKTSFKDIISGKGGGCIFLLHGQPGTGKTLTAEAIAELLHRPLYSVSVGELGTDTEELETKLREILEVASVWNAVVLLDEADIFLEKRTEHDVKRNAMVGVFLRLLEYHQGVLFLTTNRVKSFDPAFHSRISVALRYPDLDQSQREQVWTRLLAAAGVEDVDVKQLSGYEINGRQIKTTIRLAQALALNQGRQVENTHIEQTVSVARQFCDDLASASTW